MPKIEVLNVRRCNEAAHSENLQPDEVQVLENMVLDRPAWENKPFVRGGFALEKGVENNTPITRMQDVMDKSDNACLLFCSGGRLAAYYDNGSVNSLISGANSQGVFHTIPLGQGDYLTSNGYDRPSVLSDEYLATVRPLVVSSPGLPSTVTVQEGGSLTANSYYRWIIVYVTEKGEISEVTSPITVNNVGDYISDGATTTATAKQVAFTGIPNSGDTRVTGKRIYRTKGKGRVFYLAATLEATTTNFTDSIADDQLDTGETLTFLGTPRSMTTVTYHRGRVFGGNFNKDYTNALMPPAMSNIRFRYATAPASPNLGLPVGTYYFAISYVDQDGRESALSPAASFSVTYLGDQSGIPYGRMELWTSGWPLPRIGAAEIDKSIASINFYRSKVNQWGGPFYLLQTISVQQLADTPELLRANAQDDALIQQFPIKAKKSTDTVAFENGLTFSDINRPSMFPQENVLLVYPEENDSITGIVDDGDGLLVFKNNSISKVFTSGSPISWRTVRISSVLGCTHPETLVQTDSRVYFVHNKEAWVYSRGEFKLLSEPKKATFLNLSSIKSACYWTERKWLVITGENALGSVILCYDEKLDSWYHFTSKITKSSGGHEDTIQSVAERRYGAKKGRLTIGTWNDLWFYNEGSYQDWSWTQNQDVEVHMTSRTFIFDNGVGKARLRKIWIRCRTYNAMRPSTQHYVKDMRTNLYRGYSGLTSTDGAPVRFSVDAWTPVANPDDCIVPEKMVYMFQGTIMAFLGMELSFNVINRGSRG
ncbi:MAG: hypothetical protein ACM3QX_18235 [Syntrophomonadaceae bacterium]